MTSLTSGMKSGKTKKSACRGLPGHKEFLPSLQIKSPEIMSELLDNKRYIIVLLKVIILLRIKHINKYWVLSGGKKKKNFYIVIDFSPQNSFKSVSILKSTLS